MSLKLESVTLAGKESVFQLLKEASHWLNLRGIETIGKTYIIRRKSRFIGLLMGLKRESFLKKQ